MSNASVSLDRALLGAGHIEDVRVTSLGGAAVRVRVLSPTELKAIGVSTSGVAENSGTLAGLTERSRVLHAACAMPDNSPAFATIAEVLALDATIVAELWRVYRRIHDRTYAIDGALESAIEESVNGPLGNIERFRAHHAVGLCAFYGLPRALDATTAQIMWFYGLLKEDK